MMGFDRTDDYQPLTYIKGHPLYVTTLVIVLHVAAFVIGCFLFAFRQGEAMQWLQFSTPLAVEHFQLWRVASYAFLHLPSGGLWFAFEMFLLFRYGQEVEKYLGRRVFVALYAALLVTPPIALSLVGSVSHVPMMLGGSALVHFGVFIIFAALYPGVQLCFGILAKWIVLALLGIYTLILLAGRDSAGLLALWSTASVAYFGTRQAGGGAGEFSLLDNLREKFPRRPAPAGLKPRAKPRRALNDGEGSGDVYESIDPLLDKISEHGLASLTHSERATLERARVSLLRKDRAS